MGWGEQYGNLPNVFFGNREQKSETQDGGFPKVEFIVSTLPVLVTN